MNYLKSVASLFVFGARKIHNFLKPCFLKAQINVVPQKFQKAFNFNVL